MQKQWLAFTLSPYFCVSQRARRLGKITGCGAKAFPLNLTQLLKLQEQQQHKKIKHPFLLSVASYDFPLSNSADFVCLQWLVGNVVQRDDALYARMKQREIDAYDSMWDPIFVDDAALGLGEQRNKVLEVLKVKTNNVINLNQSRSEENAVVFVHFFDFYRFLRQLWSSLPPLCFSLSWFALHAFSWQTWLSSLISAGINFNLNLGCISKLLGKMTNMAKTKQKQNNKHQ